MLDVEKCNNIQSLQCWRSIHRRNDVVTCEIKLFQNYFSLRRRPSEIILGPISLCENLIVSNYFKIISEAISAAKITKNLN